MSVSCTEDEDGNPSDAKRSEGADCAKLRSYDQTLRFLRGQCAGPEGPVR